MMNVSTTVITHRAAQNTTPCFTLPPPLLPSPPLSPSSIVAAPISHSNGVTTPGFEEMKETNPAYRAVWLRIFLCPGNYGDLESGQDSQCSNRFLFGPTECFCCKLELSVSK